ncbi:hypothetical protein C8R43DRAFT_536053 [Mycena crocata]|nr:hypothetical protein C8R43DRAFT_536053 [Mycena crocata]
MSNRRQTRSSLLVQAGDALASMRFGRRRPSIRQPSEQPILAVPHVIDITAPPDEELEERQRLRDAAAQSIGLGPLLDPQQEEDVQQKEEQEQEEVQSPPLPPFPAAYKALQPVSTLAAALPKYYPPPSLRIFALAKQWKPRHLLLSIPFPAHAAAAYLHLFKGAAQDDRELERLEITADSVVFVAESLGSPGLDLAHVVKVGGVDVGALRRDWNLTDDAGRTVWLLHLASPQEAQRWISAIKSAIFAQRAQRAGLGPARALEGTEPRGDMDVMLSMRLHAAASPPAVSTSTSALAFPNSNSPVSSTSSPGANLSIDGNTNGATDTRPPPPPTPTSPTYPASLAPSASERSVRSVQTHPRAASTSEKRKSATASDKHRPSSSEKELGNGKDRDGKRPSSPAVAALKGLFSRPRPRSSSAASVVSAASSSYTHAPHHTHALSSSSSHGFSSSSYGLSSVSSSPATSYRNAPNGVLAGDDTAAKSSSSYGSAEEMVAAMASANGDNSFARMGTLLAASSSSFASSPLQHAPLPSLHSNATSAYHPASTGPPPPLANAKRGLPVGGAVGVSATTSTGLNGVNGGDALGRRIVVPGERERELVEGRRSVDVDADFDASTVDEDVGGTISHPFAQAQTHDPPPKRRFGIRMSQQSQVNGNGNGHIPHTNGHMSLQPPPRTRMMKRWMGDAGGTLDEEYAGANGSANGYSGDNGNESGYSANGSANGYFGHANGYNGSTSVAGSPSTTGSFYAHPHANGSSGTAGSFGVRERAPSREGSFGRDRAPSVRTAYSAQGSVDGHDHGATYVGPTTPNPDHMSVRSASTSRSRASSVGGASSGNNTASPTNSGKGRRWSTLPRRLTPPASPPPAAPTAARSIPHPYAAGDEPSQHERASSRASGRSFGSTGTGRGSGGGLGTWTRPRSNPLRYGMRPSS